jgi:Ca2+-binding EF-hand superfamily protein
MYYPPSQQQPQMAPYAPSPPPCQPQYAPSPLQSYAPQPSYPGSIQQPSYSGCWGVPVQQQQQQSPVPPHQQAYGMPVQQQPQPQVDPCRAWFDAVDCDHNGRITSHELKNAMSRALNFDFSLATAQRMLRMHDRDMSGTISFVEFQELYRFMNSMVAGFRQRDIDRSGLLEGREVRAAILGSGYMLSEPTFQLMMRKFDRDQLGGLKMDDYIELSIAIGMSRNVFAFYDRQRTGQVMFNFDQFFSANLSCTV